MVAYVPADGTLLKPGAAVVTIAVKHRRTAIAGPAGSMPRKTGSSRRCDLSRGLGGSVGRTRLALAATDAVTRTTRPAPDTGWELTADRDRHRKGVDTDADEIWPRKAARRAAAGSRRLTLEEAEDTLAGRPPSGASIDDATRIERTYRFRNFRDRVGFVEQRRAGRGQEGQHPDIIGLGTRRLAATKKIKGLHENDFIMATKLDRIVDVARR